MGGEGGCGGPGTGLIYIYIQQIWDQVQLGESENDFIDPMAPLPIDPSADSLQGRLHFSWRLGSSTVLQTSICLGVAILCVHICHMSHNVICMCMYIYIYIHVCVCVTSVVCDVDVMRN